MSDEQDRSVNRLGSNRELAPELNYELGDRKEVQQSEEMESWINRIQANETNSSRTTDRIQRIALELWQEAEHQLGVDTSTDASNSKVSFPKIEGYEVTGFIGEGGMGTVYRAKEIELGRTVALKVLVNDRLGSERAKQRFKVEVQAAAQLTHPSIVPVYAFGEYENGLFYSMQEIQGVDLGKRLADSCAEANSDQSTSLVSGQSIASRDYQKWAAGVARSIADALAHSHERFVIHRDIKPANIILDEAERPFLADFGLARLNEGSELTKDQDILGSLRYMSPEQFESNHQVDFRSDIYSLGITLYEMLAGRPAVQNSNLAVVCQQVREGRIESPRSVNSSIELDLETIVLKAMSPEPELRYASAAEFRDDLDRYLNVLPVHAKPPTLSLMVSRWIRRNRKWVTALGIVVASLSLVIFAIAIFTSIRASNDEKKIRSASAKLWENAGIEKLSDGRALLSVADFEQAISLASNEVESQTHQQRIDGVDAWSAKLVESKEYQGRLLASSGANEVTVELQDGVSTCILHGDNIRKELFSTDRIVRKAAFSSDGNWCAILTGDRTNLDPEIRIYNRISEDLYLVSEKLDWRVTHLFFLEDNRTLFFTGWNGTAELWDVIDQKRVRSEVYETGSKKGWVFAAARDTSREKMVAVAFPGKLVGYELPELKPLWDPIDLGSWKTETLQLSKFGKWIVAGTVEKGVRLWHVDTGQEVRLPNRPNSRPTAATFSADETKLAVADHFGNIILWELSDSDGAEATRIGMAMQHGLAVQSLRFNDRLHLASASSNEIKIWRIEDSREITSSIPVKNGVGSFQWVDSDHLVISTRGNSGVMTQKWQLPQHLSLELKGDGELAELIKRNGKVFVSTCVKQDLRNGKIASINTDFNKEGRPTGLKNQIAFRSAVQHFSLSEDGLSAFVVEENDGVSTVARYAFPSMELNSVPVKLEYAPRTIDFETHGSYWATSDIQNNIIVRSFDDGKVLLKSLLPNWVKDVGITNDGSIVSTCWDGKLRIWNSEGSLVDEFNHASLPDMMEFNGSQLVVAHGKEYSLYRFENDRWHFRKSVTHGLGTIEFIEFSEDDSRFVTCGDNGQTKLWTKDAEFVASLSSAGPVSDVRSSRDHGWIATLGDAGGINLWDAKTGKPMSATIFGLEKIEKIEWSEESLYFGGQTSDNYWLQKITLPESWRQ